VWVAQRVPPDHISVVTNAYVIGEIDLDDTSNYMASSNIFAVATNIGLYDPSTDVFDFAQIYRSAAGHVLPGFKNPPMLRDRRRWVVYHTAAPSQVFNPYDEHTWNDDDTSLPFSIKPDKLLSVRDVFRLHRDTYQNTQFDIAKSGASGPFGDPFRGKMPHPMNDTDPNWEGSFERAVAQLWTSYTVISQSRAHIPDERGGGRFFFGPHSAMTTLFTPVYPVAAKNTERLPTNLEVGSLQRFSGDSFWWVVTLTANYAARFMSYNLPVIEEEQKTLEEMMLAVTRKAEEAAVAAESDEAAGAILEQMQEEISATMFMSWNTFFYWMVGNLHDGLFFRPTAEGGVDLYKKVFYPRWWAEFLGAKGAGYAETHVAGVEGAVEEGARNGGEGVAVSTLVVVAGCALLVGGAIGNFRRKGEEHKYQVIV